MRPVTVFVMAAVMQVGSPAVFPSPDPGWPPSADCSGLLFMWLQESERARFLCATQAIDLPPMTMRLTGSSPHGTPSGTPPRRGSYLEATQALSPPPPQRQSPSAGPCRPSQIVQPVQQRTPQRQPSVAGCGSPVPSMQLLMSLDDPPAGTGGPGHPIQVTHPSQHEPANPASINRFTLY